MMRFLLSVASVQGALIPKRTTGQSGLPLRLPPSLNPQQPSSTAVVASTTTPSNYAEAQLELQRLKERMEKMERQWSVAVSEAALLSGEVSSEGGDSRDDSGLAVNTVRPSARTLELCTAAAFFVIGYVLGASLFDRLGFLGGVSAAFWSSGAIKSDTRAGTIARDIGRRLAQGFVFLRLKWEELVVFYKTGKLAFLGKAQYEKLDTRFGIEQRIAEFKRLSMVRISELGQQEVAGRDKLSDFLRVVSKNVRDPEFRSSVQTRGVSLAQSVAQTVPQFLPKIKVVARPKVPPPTPTSERK
jgi:hypothetical protein